MFSVVKPIEPLKLIIFLLFTLMLNPDAVHAETSPIAKSDVSTLTAQWHCSVEALAANSAAHTGSAEEVPDSLTVGSKFILRCEGPPAALNKEKLELELPKAQRFLLRLLETRKLTDEGAVFVATSWSSGVIKLDNPVLTDGEHRVGLGSFQVTVKSVIDAKANPDPKPYPPWSAMRLAWPVWLWFIATAFFLLLALALSGRVVRWNRRKKLLKLLEQNPVAGDPFHQFNRELRRLTRTIPTAEGIWSSSDRESYLNGVDEILRWHLARTLVLPVLPIFQRSSGEIAKDFRRQYPLLFEQRKNDLSMILRELDRARNDPSLLSVEDAHQIAELARTLADRLHETRKAV